MSAMVLGGSTSSLPQQMYEEKFGIVTDEVVNVIQFELRLPIAIK